MSKIDFRSAIVTELLDRKRKGLDYSRYWLGEELERRGVCNSETLMRFLRGDRDTSASVIAEIFDILGFALVNANRIVGLRQASRRYRPGRR